MSDPLPPAYRSRGPTGERLNAILTGKGEVWFGVRTAAAVIALRRGKRRRDATAARPVRRERRGGVARHRRVLER